MSNYPGITGAFINPYKGCREYDENAKKVTAVMPLDRWKYLKCIRVEDGTIQTTINLFFEKLINELARRGINSTAEQSKYEHFVANFELVLPGERNSITGSLSETSVGNDRPGVGGVCSENKDYPPIGGNVESHKGRGNRTTTKGKEKTQRVR
jgi:hypothetical protein